MELFREDGCMTDAGFRAMMDGQVVLRHLAVVLHTHFGQILQPFTGDPFVGVRGLFLGKGDAERLDAATGGGDDHRTPAAADVQ